jgi:hypothetical protein
MYFCLTFIQRLSEARRVSRSSFDGGNLDFSFEQEMGPPGPDFGFDQSEYAQQMDAIQEEPTHDFQKGLTPLQKTPFEDALLYEAETSEVEISSLF